MTQSDGNSLAVEVMGRLRGDGLEFFMNSRLEPTVRIPDDGFQQDWPADSMRFQDLALSVAYEANEDTLPKNSEMAFLHAQIREECRKGGRRLSQVEVAETESDAIVQGALCYLNNEIEFDGRTVELVEKLRALQDRGRLSAKDEIPVFTNIFSRRLRRLIPVLRGYGIGTEFRHQEDGSYCKLTRLANFQREVAGDTVMPDASDGSQKEPSGKPSAISSSNGTELQVSDDTDGAARMESPGEKARLLQERQPSFSSEADGDNVTAPPLRSDDNLVDGREGGAE
ncbi:MAG: hypothetical protein DWQ31_11725 [Planctomycetota bacterium]|nr:MAG: hypothetical protein DWQ31_11725 [Planctomycetota bacterium]